jgi:hypothetical protein
MFESPPQTADRGRCISLAISIACIYQAGHTEGHGRGRCCWGWGCAARKQASFLDNLFERVPYVDFTTRNSIIQLAVATKYNQKGFYNAFSGDLKLF